MKRICLSFSLLFSLTIVATDYHVGPNESLTTISEVPWTTLQPGDNVYIHWRATPYNEKWVINRSGTISNPISIIGINGPQGEQPVIDGNNAVTVSNVNFWNENRGVIKIGGSSVPADGLPSHIIIENLDIRSGRPPYQFIDQNNQIKSYVNNAASIYVEKAKNLIIRKCTLHDSGNGLFIGAFDGATQDVLIEKNHIYDNGNVGSLYEHNTYTACINITYQYNHFGPLRSGANGNNLKDRSAGLVVRNNWIESGNRQLDLVDAEDSQVLVDHPSYHTTYVYGNILIEPNNAGNSQIVHYGGDSGTTSIYRKGTLYFYNNTVISTRTGNTTLIRLSTNEETVEVFNNVIYTSASGSSFAMIDDTGVFNTHHNWLKTGWVNCHCGTPSGTINNLGSIITGSNPLFVDFANQDFKLTATSPLINQGGTLPSVLLPDNNITNEYVKHQESATRMVSNALDIGAYEYVSNLSTPNQTLQNEVTVYPNPFKDTFTIELNNDTLERVTLYNQIGQEITVAYATEIDATELNSGLYYLTIFTTNGVKTTKKIIKL